jgi:hypothetical protein
MIREIVGNSKFPYEGDQILVIIVPFHFKHTLFHPCKYGPQDLKFKCEDNENDDWYCPELDLYFNHQISREYVKKRSNNFTTRSLEFEPIKQVVKLKYNKGNHLWPGGVNF